MPVITVTADGGAGDRAPAGRRTSGCSRCRQAAGQRRSRCRRTRPGRSARRRSAGCRDRDDREDGERGRRSGWSDASARVRSPVAAEDQAHRLGPGRRVAQLAADGGGDGARPGLADPAHRHAQVLALDDDDDARAARGASISASAIWVVSRSCTCGRRAKTSTSRASLDRPVIRPSVAGDVADVRDAVERHQVVLAGAVDLDVRDQDHLVVAEVEGRGEHVRRAPAAARRRSRRRPGRPGPGSRAGRRGRGPRRSRAAARGPPRSARVVVERRRVAAVDVGRRPGDLDQLVAALGDGSRRPARPRRPGRRRVVAGAGRGADRAAAVGRSLLGGRRTGGRSDGGRSPSQPDRARRALDAPARRSRRAAPCRASPSRAARAPGASRTSRLSSRIVPGLVVRGLDERAHLLVDDPGDVLGVVALVAHVAAEEDLAAAPGRA